MKKLLLLLFLLPFIIISCSKEPIQKANDIHLSNDVFDLLLDQNDEKNSKINQIIYHFANAIEEARNNETFLNLIINEVNASKINQASILEIADKNKAFKDFLNTEIAKTIHLSVNFKFTSTDYIAELARIMKYEEDKYIPIAYSISPTVRIGGNIIFAIGEQVNAEDEIIGWINGKATLINETFAMENLSTLIIIGNGEEVTLKNGSPESFLHPETTTANTGGVSGNRENYDIILDLHQIKKGYRYENSGKSDLRGFYYRYSGSCPSSTANYMNHGTLKISKRDIKKSKIFWNNETAINNENELCWDGNSWYFMGYWEYDWYASAKLITNPCDNSYNVHTNRKFSWEWYDYWCATGNSMLPNTSSLYNRSNLKSRFRFFKS